VTIEHAAEFLYDAAGRMVAASAGNELLTPVPLKSCEHGADLIGWCPRCATYARGLQP
jgi:hypothetical protein